MREEEMEVESDIIQAPHYTECKMILNKTLTERSRLLMQPHQNHTQYISAGRVL